MALLIIFSYLLPYLLMTAVVFQMHAGNNCWRYITHDTIGPIHHRHQAGTRRSDVTACGISPWLFHICKHATHVHVHTSNRHGRSHLRQAKNFLKTPLFRYQVTKSSAIADGPRDASCQLKYCQLPRNSAVRQVLNKSKLKWAEV